MPELDEAAVEAALRSLATGLRASTSLPRRRVMAAWSVRWSSNLARRRRRTMEEIAPSRFASRAAAR